MAENKNKSKKSNTNQDKDTPRLESAKKSAARDVDAPKTSRRSGEPREPIQNAVPDKPSAKFIHQFMPFVLGVFALLLAACFIWVNLSDGTGAVGFVGQWLNNILCGLFGCRALFRAGQMAGVLHRSRCHKPSEIRPVHLSY